MIIALLSDIHGNLPALHTVLDDAAEWEAEEYWCLGDVVGYGPWPYQVWQQLRILEIPQWGWVAGNHDWALVGQLNNRVQIENEHGQQEWIDPIHAQVRINGTQHSLGFFYREAGEVIEKQKDALASVPELLTSLSQLPIVASPRAGIYLTHGRFTRRDLVDNIMAYTPRAAHAAWSFTTLRKRPMPWENGPSHWQIASNEGWTAPHLLIVGHTHVPALVRCRTEGDSSPRCEDVKLPLDAWLVLEDLATFPACLNPGSVGQPRDSSGMARYALLDWLPPQPPRVCFRALTYKFERTRVMMQQSYYPSKLIELLSPEK